MSHDRTKCQMVFHRCQVKMLLESEESIVGVWKLGSERPRKGPQGVKLETITSDEKYLSCSSVSSGFKTVTEGISVQISYQCHHGSNRIRSNYSYEIYKTHGWWSVIWWRQSEYFTEAWCGKLLGMQRGKIRWDRRGSNWGGHLFIFPAWLYGRTWCGGNLTALRAKQWLCYILL